MADYSDSRNKLCILYRELAGQHVDFSNGTQHVFGGGIRRCRIIDKFAFLRGAEAESESSVGGKQGELSDGCWSSIRINYPDHIDGEMNRVRRAIVDGNAIPLSACHELFAFDISGEGGERARAGGIRGRWRKTQVTRSTSRSDYQEDVIKKNREWIWKVVTFS